MGEAGIGKTTLIGAAVEAVADFTVLQARGIECEGEVGGAVLSELLGQSSRLRPELRGACSSLPKRLRRAVHAVQRLRPLAGDRFSVVAAWAALVAAACETRPVLVVLDDGQWCDQASLEAVLFAARRLRDVRVATLVAVREPPRAPAAFDGLDRLELGRLDPESAALVASRDGEPAPDVVEAAGWEPTRSRGDGATWDRVGKARRGSQALRGIASPG